jgi:hypothetical protein
MWWLLNPFTPWWVMRRHIVVLRRWLLHPLTPWWLMGRHIMVFRW